MKLPKAHLAVVEQRKIVDYLLNAAHPDNGGKAGFFTAMGFSVEAWQVLAAVLCSQVIELEFSRAEHSEHGQKFIFDGEISTPVGRRPRVRSIWIIDHGKDQPRFVTAYPLS